jgi:hypothetical protein
MMESSFTGIEDNDNVTVIQGHIDYLRHLREVSEVVLSLPSITIIDVPLEKLILAQCFLNPPTPSRSVTRPSVE